MQGLLGVAAQLVQELARLAAFQSRQTMSSATLATT